MKKLASALLVSLLLLSVVVAPAAAAPPAAPLGAEPPDGPPPIHLPLVANGATPAQDEVRMIEGSIVVGTDPVFADVTPKADMTVDLAPAPAPDEEKAPAPPEPGADGIEFPSLNPADMSPNDMSPDGWTTILNDGMETSPWPLSPLWRILDTDGALNGTYYWNDENDLPYRGGWSAWPAGNVLDGSGPYAPNMRTWMIYGPFSLADAARASLTFQYWAQTEFNFDWFGFFASPNGSNFYGNWVTGSSNGFRPGVIDFGNVPGYGSMLGDSSVWIGFYFYSDPNIQLRGPFVDDVFIQKFNCPSQFTAFWYNSLAQSAASQRAVTCEGFPFARNWSTTGPVPLFGQADNWSLYMTSTPFFPTSKVWTFEARSDDGVAVWVDGVKVINAWFDQSGTVTYKATRFLTAGVHTVWVQYYERTGSAQLNVRWY